MENKSNSSGATAQYGKISDPQRSVHHSVLASGSKVKGVVSQANGLWGAQIYSNHTRIWLGTFQTLKDAALAYDRAALKLCHGSHRNLPWNHTTRILEPQFQAQFTPEAVLDMIKDGSYSAKFFAYLRTNPGDENRVGPPGVNLRQLFQKELTPSDVGKLNRIVIPKMSALEYLPTIDLDGGRDSINLVLYDRSMTPWRFRYCYWSSSSTFVITKGWNAFVTEKVLRAKDRVIFSSYRDTKRGGRKVLTIDVVYNNDDDDDAMVEDGRHAQMDLVGGFEPNVDKCEEGAGNQEKKGFKLFGMQIM